MNRRTGSLVNRRITVLVVVLLVAVSLAMHGAFSQASPSSNRKAINLPDDSPKAPFSGAILSGNTLYISGRIGIDSKTGNAPANLDEEIKLLLDHVKDTLVEAGMTMDDLPIFPSTTNSTRLTAVISLLRNCRRENLLG